MNIALVFKIRVLIFISLFIYSENLYSTEQYKDKLIINNKVYSINKYPFEEYFDKFPSKRPTGISTALYRGYVATFEISENKLFLRDIEVELRNNNSETYMDQEWESIIDKLFMKQEQIEIDWFNGVIVMEPINQRINIGAKKEKYIIGEFQYGKIVYKKILYEENEIEFRLKQFKAFKRKKLYKKLFKEMRKEIGMEKKVIRETLFHDVLNLIETIKR